MRRFVFLLGLSACGGGAGGPAGAGELSASWVGTDTGAFRAGATARWCRRDSMVEVFASRGDTAVGFTLLSTTDSVVATAYSVLSTEIFIPLRPQGGTALRYMDLQELKGFDGTSGRIVVRSAGSGGLSGEFESVLRRQGTTDTLRIRGTFAGVPVTQAQPMCGRAAKPGN